MLAAFRMPFLIEKISPEEAELSGKLGPWFLTPEDRLDSLNNRRNAGHLGSCVCEPCLGQQKFHSLLDVCRKHGKPSVNNIPTVG
jgi:hypothetical protein